MSSEKMIGIKIYDAEIKLYILCLNADKNSLCGVMRLLDWLKISGLGINKDETKVINNGAVRDRCTAWESKFGLNRHLNLMS